MSQTEFSLQIFILSFLLTPFQRDTFYRLYSYYCQNIPRSERLRETLVDTHLFLQECQKRLGHKLPLAAYLLKPVQRITKYQLLLKDLLRFTDSGTCAKELQKALDCMLIVLKCVNDSMHQIAITGFPVSVSSLTNVLNLFSLTTYSLSGRSHATRRSSASRLLPSVDRKQERSPIAFENAAKTYLSVSEGDAVL